MSILDTIGNAIGSGINSLATFAGNIANTIGAVNQIKQTIKPGSGAVISIGPGGGAAAPPPRQLPTLTLPPIQRQSIAGAALPGGMSMSLLGNVGGLIKSGLPAIKTAGGAVARVANKYPALTAAAVGVVGGMLVDAAGNILGPAHRRYRRINPCNAKAARRAIRRIKGVRKLLHSIEKQLPKQRSSGHCAPAFTRKRKCR